MGFDVLRASVGYVDPGAAIRPPPELDLLHFDYVCFIDHGRRFAAFERRPDESRLVLVALPTREF